MPQESIEGASVTLEEGQGDALRLLLSGRLDAETSGGALRAAQRALGARRPARLRVEAGDLAYCDTAGAALIDALRRRQEEGGGTFEFEGGPSGLAELLAALEAAPAEPARPASLEGGVARIGRGAVDLVADVGRLVAFVGEVTLAAAWAARNPRRVRWRDAIRIAERAGVDALPIVALVAFLMGLIMAFQSALPMKQFGVELFVADLVGISMVRELGPLMTGIVLAGRSGSAFAAELGTMKVGEELDALATMGLEPVRFLVLGRVMAGLLLTPLLALFAMACGLLGGLVVFLSFGFPVVTYGQQVGSAVDLVGLQIGLAKAAVFGLLVAGIGCQRGLETGRGASAVGLSTTRAVVSGIVLITVADGVFSALVYALGL